MATKVRIFYRKFLALSPPPPITDLSNRGQRSSGMNASLGIAGGILQIKGHVSFRNQGVQKLLDIFFLVTARLSRLMDVCPLTNDYTKFCSSLHEICKFHILAPKGLR
jgi:hypothetical protein